MNWRVKFFLKPSMLLECFVIEVETDLVLHYMSPLQLNANSQVKNVELESPDDVANKFRAIVSSFRLSNQWENLFQAEGH